MHPNYILLLAFALSGCSLAPIQPVASHSTNMTFSEATASMAELVGKCWTHASHPMKNDEIGPIATHGQGLTVITIGRDNTDISFIPFARIRIIEQEGGAVIDVEEGDAAYGGGYNVKDSVARWLSGDKDCRPLDLQKLDYGDSS